MFENTLNELYSKPSNQLIFLCANSLFVCLSSGITIWLKLVQIDKKNSLKLPHKYFAGEEEFESYKLHLNRVFDVIYFRSNSIHPIMSIFKETWDFQRHKKICLPHLSTASLSKSFLNVHFDFQKLSVCDFT